MEQDEKAFVSLQMHLDKQAVGFPSTRSKAEIKILKHIFTPQEARIAANLSYKHEPLETVFGRVRHLVASSGELEEILGNILKKGGIESKIKDGKRHYCNAPLVVGMYEFQIGRLTREFIKDFNDYTRDHKFGIEFLSTELPQMRTIPIAESIRVRHHVSTFDEAASLLRRAEPPFVVAECICRKKREMEGKPCKATDRKETCLALGSIAQSALMSGNGREISGDEAMAVIEKNQKQGLVLQPSNTEKADFICSCCGCCCGILGIHKRLPNPMEFWASNFYAAADVNACVGCGVCQKRCQVGAVSVSEKKQAVVNMNRCIGCGVCVPACPENAMSLVKKPVEITPPETREDLYDTIMAKKKGRLGKLKLKGKLLFDALRY